MDQMEMLWQYQHEDIKADKIAAEMRKSPTRQKLEKDRDFIKEQQAQFKRLEEKNSVMADRMDMIRDALPHCEEQLQKLSETLKQNPPTDAAAVQALLQEANRCRETIIAYEKELNGIVRETRANMSTQRNLRLEAARVKQEFDALKVSYDNEVKEQRAQYEAQRAAAAARAASIPAELMEAYAQVKKHVSPPLARLNNNQCGGCCTSLASAQLSKIKAGTLVECETCGRILII